MNLLLLGMKRIADAIRENDITAYQEARYPTVPDGEPVTFRDEDFSGIDFEYFPLGLSEFHHCNLDDAKHLYGQPITFEDSSARRIDLRGVSMILYARGCDFEGALYDENTRLAYDETTVSRFKDCFVDEAMRRYFSDRGVIFD